MPTENAYVIDIFNRVADLLEIEGANPFRVRAYREAARTLSGLSSSVTDMIDGGEDLSKLPAIGKDLAAKIKVISDTGDLPLLKKVEARTPGVLSDLMKVEGLGPKRVKTLYDKLDIGSIEDLERAARSGQIRDLAGFGPKTESLIRKGVERYRRYALRTGLAAAESIARPLIEYLQGIPGVKRVTIAGSFRRRSETVGDLDILVVARRNSSVTGSMADYPEVEEVMASGKTRATLTLKSGMHVDLRVVAPVSYGAALLYFTGSKPHSILLRKRAVKLGLKLNEYGLFKANRRVAGKTEKSVYERISLPYIVPELRENRGELEAAENRRLPVLLRQQDIRGDLHCHTRATDGRNTLEEMVDAARRKGYEYIAITDHSQRVRVARGLDVERLRNQIREIDRLNEKLDQILVLKSVEVDILEDGSLDLPDSILRQLDMTVCAIHYGLDLSRNKQTERILRAMDNRSFNILAHPTGRLIGKRQAYAVDIEAVLAGARERNCFLELNGHPERLDLNDIHCRAARDIGVKLALTTDAHSVGDLDNLRFGIDQARRGWLGKKDVLNTVSLSTLVKLLDR